METAYLEIIVVGLIWVLSGIIGKYCGKPRGNGRAGFWFGFLLGPIGWIIAAVLPETGRKCPACKGVVKEGATRCCHCGEHLSAGWNKK